MTDFYSHSPDTMERLGRFLAATQGYQLELICDDRTSYGDDYSEFEPDEGPDLY